MPKLYYKDKPVIGIDINQTGIKVMAVDVKKWLVSAYGSIDLDPAKATKSLEGDGTYIKESLAGLIENNLVGNLPSNHAIMSVPASNSFTRAFSMPIEIAKNIDSAIELEIDQYIPIPAASLYVDYEVISQSKDKLAISMSAAPKKLIDNLIGAAEGVNLRVCAVEPSTSSVARLLNRTEDGHLPTVIIDIGPASTDIAILDDIIKVTGSISQGGNTFTLDIAKKLGVSLEKAHQLKIINGLSYGPRQKKLRAALEPSLNAILNETRKVIRYYNERLDTKTKLEQVLVVGGGSNIPGIGDFFTNSLVMPARVASPWQKLNFGKLPQPAKQFRPRYITVAGLASIDPEEVRQ
ncbi:pilus assembly protein PilM [Candidatus Saccharibacteria bacterium]|nr:pilus assembly protein PilM [Candidatus Saccharibacteria bacterium]